MVWSWLGGRIELSDNDDDDLTTTDDDAMAGGRGGGGGGGVRVGIASVRNILDMGNLSASIRKPTQVTACGPHFCALSYTSTPRDGGYVRLGPNQRMFSVALTH